VVLSILLESKELQMILHTFISCIRPTIGPTSLSLWCLLLSVNATAHVLFVRVMSLYCIVIVYCIVLYLRLIYCRKTATATIDAR